MDFNTLGIRSAHQPVVFLTSLRAMLNVCLELMNVDYAVTYERQTMTRVCTQVLLI